MVGSSHSWRLNGPIAFLRVLYTNWLSVWPALRSSAALAKHQPSIWSMQLRREGRVLVERVLEAGREVDLGRLDRREVVEQLVGQRGRAVLDGAGEAVLARDLAELARTSKSSLTSATPPSGSGTPPWRCRSGR